MDIDLILFIVQRLPIVYAVAGSSVNLCMQNL